MMSTQYLGLLAPVSAVMIRGCGERLLDDGFGGIVGSPHVSGAIVCKWLLALEGLLLAGNFI